MEAYDLFLIAWWSTLLIVLMAGIGYAIKESRRHKPHKKRRRIPLAKRWWMLIVGE